VSSPELISLFISPLNRLQIRYMVTGAVAATIYGEPRLTNDIDVVVALSSREVETLRNAFSDPDFYVPPADAIEAELNRPMHGHFNFIHVPTSLKADFYTAGNDPLHAWALARCRRISVSGENVVVAPPEYVVIRKLEYLKAGGSDRHRRDVQSILRTTGGQLDRKYLIDEVRRRGLEAEWRSVDRPEPER
jgi:hypothetical protein